MAHAIVDVTDLEPLNGVVRLLRPALGVTAFGVNQLELPPNAEGPEHDHAADGQEEVYAVIGGGGTIRLDGREEELRPGRFVFLSPDQRRQMVAGAEGLTYIGIGCQPGAYRPPQPPKAART
jgi:quercetin dioxygenase-like cupin family protein